MLGFFIVPFLFLGSPSSNSDSNLFLSWKNTLSLYFLHPQRQTSPLPEGKRRFIQFITRYQHSNGQTRLRATTLCGPWYNPPPGEGDKAQPPPSGGVGGGYNGTMQQQPSPMKMSFDQEAAAVANPNASSLHVVDIFACSLDQVGLLEMAELVEATGGHMVLGDSFGQSVFKESLRRVFRVCEPPQDGSSPPSPDDGMMQMGFGATLEVLTSREFKVSGAIGPVTSLGKKSPNVSDLEVGRGGTNAWSLGGIDPGTTIAVYFDITNPGVSLVSPLIG